MVAKRNAEGREEWCKRRKRVEGNERKERWNGGRCINRDGKKEGKRRYRRIKEGRGRTLRGDLKGAGGARERERDKEGGAKGRKRQNKGRRTDDIEEGGVLAQMMSCT